MNKYQLMFMEQLDKTLTLWLGGGKRTWIENKDVYRLLHSIRGTAGTMGLDPFSETAGELLSRMDEEGDKLWSSDEITVFLAPLFDLRSKVKRDGAVEDSGASASEPGPLQENGGSANKGNLVLLLDDDVSLLQVLKDALESAGWMVMATPSAEQAVHLFYELNPDCVILDITMGTKSGFEILGSIQRQADVSFIPIIMMSAKDDKATRIRCYEEGADAYCRKPIDLDELMPRMRRLLHRRTQLKQLMLQDPVLGIYTRKFLLIELAKRMAFSSREGVLGLLCLDIDGFAEVNDIHGHHEGNRLLQEYVRIVQAMIGPADLMVRDHGDRFFVLLEGRSHEEIVALAEKLLAGIGGFGLSTGKGTYSRKASAGAVFVDNKERPAEEYLDQAVSLMNRAKQAGGGRLFSDAPLPSAVSQPSLRLAIIDDDPLLCKMLARKLAEIGGEELPTEVRIYSDGEQFFDDPWHEDGAFYMIVLDRMMPRMNGMEVLRKLRTQYNRRKYRVIMLTGIDSDEEIVAAIEEGTDDYLTKPFSIIELEARIRRFFWRKR